MWQYRFADERAFQFLTLIPVILGLAWYMARANAGLLGRKVAPRIANYLTRSVSRGRRRAKLGLQLAAVFFFVIALARPQSGEGRQKAKNEGLEIVLAVDVSNSMMSEDARPSRLELAKKELSRFLDTLGGDKVGLVAFAGSAILLSPLTTDKGALKMYLDSLSPDAVSTQGTDFRRALNESYNALNRGGIEADADRGVTRVIIVASDGEEQERGGLEAAKRIAGEGVRIYTLGFGTEDGGQIPMRDRDNNLVGYKRDRAGQPVISKLTGEALKALAEAGKGTYAQVTFGGDAVQQLKGRIDTLQRTQFETMDVSHYDEHYQIFLLLGLLCALGDLALSERRREGTRWRGRFEVAGD